MLKAVIFDLDGVVADSHPIHEAAWKTLLAEEGLDPAKINVDFLYAGHPRREILRHYLGDVSEARAERLRKRKDELYQQAAENLAPKPGIPRVLDELEAEGIAFALATSGARGRTLETLAKFGMTDRFAAVVTGEEVSSAKPAPDIFLLAASRVEVLPEESIVVEDSVAGVQAALASGMCCVGYALPERLFSLREAGAHDVIADFPLDAAGYFQRILERSFAVAPGRRHGFAAKQGE
jgi:beta-phosphoglucomutase